MVQFKKENRFMAISMEEKNSKTDVHWNEIYMFLQKTNHKEESEALIKNKEAFYKIGSLLLELQMKLIVIGLEETLKETKKDVKEKLNEIQPLLIKALTKKNLKTNKDLSKLILKKLDKALEAL